MEIPDNKAVELNKILFAIEGKRSRLLQRGTTRSREERNQLAHYMRGMTVAAEILGIELEGRWAASFYKRRN